MGTIWDSGIYCIAIATAFTQALKCRNTRNCVGKASLYDVIAGNFFICGFSGEEFCSLTDKQFRYYEKLFRDPELFLPTPVGIMPMKCTPDQYKRLMQERSAANRGER